MKKVIFLLLLFILIPTIKAYENEYFSIELDESFKEKTIEDKKYIFQKDNDYISITIEDNKNNYDVSKFTDKDIEKHKDYLSNEYKAKLKDYTESIEISNVELKNTNTIYYLEYDVSMNTKKTIGYNIYQRCRMYTTNNYVYVIVYNTDKQIENNNLLDTFTLKDRYLRKINTLVYKIILVVMAVLLVIFYYLMNKKRHN